MNLPPLASVLKPVSYDLYNRQKSNTTSLRAARAHGSGAYFRERLTVIFCCHFVRLSLKGNQGRLAID